MEDTLGEPVGLRVDVPLVVVLGLPVWDAVDDALGVAEADRVCVCVRLALPLPLGDPDWLDVCVWELEDDIVCDVLAAHVSMMADRPTPR